MYISYAGAAISCVQIKKLQSIHHLLPWPNALCAKVSVYMI